MNYFQQKQLSPRGLTLCNPRGFIWENRSPVSSHDNKQTLKGRRGPVCLLPVQEVLHCTSVPASEHTHPLCVFFRDSYSPLTQTQYQPRDLQIFQTASHYSKRGIASQNDVKMKAYKLDNKSCSVRLRPREKAWKTAIRGWMEFNHTETHTRSVK